MIDLSSFKLHIFDLDDTLVNTKEAYWTAQIDAVCDTFPEVSEKQIRQLAPILKWLCQIFGSSKVREYMDAFLKSEPAIFSNSKQKLDTLVSQYHLHFKSHFVCFEGVTEYLHSLNKTNKSIAIVSNGRLESQISKLERTGLLSYFPKQNIYISGQYAKEQEKPSPFMVEKACRETNTKAEDTIFYGNSELDILAGNLAGVSTGHFAKTTDLSPNLPKIANPDFIVQSWSTLLKPEN